VASGQWPGPGGFQADAEYLDLPEWGRKQIDDQLQVMGLAA
jgi:hypothetical protein